VKLAGAAEAGAPIISDATTATTNTRRREAQLSRSSLTNFRCSRC